MRYVVETSSGYSYAVRTVVELDYNAERAEVAFTLEGETISGNMRISNVTRISGGGDFEPWAIRVQVIPPKSGPASTAAEPPAEYEFPREPGVPAELSGKPIAPLESILRNAVASGEVSPNTARELVH